jgi:hypothetical protein
MSTRKSARARGNNGDSARPLEAVPTLQKADLKTEQIGVFTSHSKSIRDIIKRMAKTDHFLVIEQDQEIVRFNEHLRQIRALSPEQRIKHLAARAHELRDGRDRRLYSYVSKRG